MFRQSTVAIIDSNIKSTSKWKNSSGIKIYKQMVIVLIFNGQVLYSREETKLLMKADNTRLLPKHHDKY